MLFTCPLYRDSASIKRYILSPTHSPLESPKNWELILKIRIEKGEEDVHTYTYICIAA
jgi:hypothetical protein